MLTNGNNGGGLHLSKARPSRLKASISQRGRIDISLVVDFLILQHKFGYFFGNLYSLDLGQRILIAFQVSKNLNVISRFGIAEV